MPWMIPVAMIAAAGISAAASATSSANQQKDAANSAQSGMDQWFNTAANAQKPYQQYGEQALGTLGGMMKGGAFNTSPTDYQAPAFQDQQFNFESDPGYQFRLQEGQKAIQNQAAARGGLLSGATLKALSTYNQGQAAQNYQAAFSRYANTRDYMLGKYQSDRSFGYNQSLNQYQQQNQQAQQNYERMMQQVGVGQQAAGNMSDLAAGMINPSAENRYQYGNAQAAGTMGVGQAAASGLSNLANYYTTQQYANRNQGGYQSIPSNESRQYATMGEITNYRPYTPAPVVQNYDPYSNPYSQENWSK